jgi:MoaA/NifB/PqqE/SkfB family radical SAM enzyme
MMLAPFAIRLLRETHPRLLARCLWSAGWHGMRAVNRFKRDVARGGPLLPPFLFISVTARCNLRCRGCWVSSTPPAAELSLPVLERLVGAWRARGARFFGLLGGEPLLHDGLFDLIGRHRDCYFQLFTNGTLFTAETARTLRRLGNVTPLISIEGLERESDARRGGQDVFRRAVDALEHCRRERLLTGVASSVCRSNLDEVATPAFLADLVRRGAHYMWYYIYRPAGPDPCPELALGAADIVRLRRFLVEQRRRQPLLLIDAYWDHLGRALCPAAVGISHHVNPAGDVEPCPPIQFACDNVADSPAPAEVVANSPFLGRFRTFARTTTRGCVLLGNPRELYDFLAAERARDSTGRGSGWRELAAMRPLADHDMPDACIPESHWFYRLAKKYWFFGFGAYG